MEELREKFALTAWFFDGRCWRDGLVAVQRSWDVVLVDAAHAARRQVFGGGPNQLLGLLQTLLARSLLRCLWLLTATPLQLDPHEVHDLLLLCEIDEHA